MHQFGLVLGNHVTSLTLYSSSWIVTTEQYLFFQTGTNGEVQYLISSGNSHGLFSMDANTGTIKLKQSLDLESQQHVNDLLYILIVQARDKGQPRSLSNDVLVTIEIKSVNEFTPKLEHPGRLYIKIPESTQVGSAILIVDATDGDFGADGTLTYSIITGNDVGSFSIDHSSGLVSVARVLDYETIVRYVLVVQVTDSGTVISQRRSTVAKVTVRLTNANDSGGVDIHVEGVAKRLTPPGDPAEHVGLKTSSTISILVCCMKMVSNGLIIIYSCVQQKQSQMTLASDWLKDFLYSFCDWLKVLPYSFCDWRCNYFGCSFKNVL